MTKREKVALEKIENQLYGINAQNVSMRWIGMKQGPSREELFDLNVMLGMIIKEIRELRETGKVDFDKIFA